MRRLKFLRGPRGTGFLRVRTAALERLDPFVAEIGSATWAGRRGFTWAEGARRFGTWEHSVAAALGRAAVNVSTTVPEDNPLDTEDRGIHPLIRFSPHYYNTEDEIDRAAELLSQLTARGLRRGCSSELRPGLWLLQGVTALAPGIGYTGDQLPSVSLGIIPMDAGRRRERRSHRVQSGPPENHDDSARTVLVRAPDPHAARHPAWPRTRRRLRWAAADGARAADRCDTRRDDHEEGRSPARHRDPGSEGFARRVGSNKRRRGLAHRRSFSLAASSALTSGPADHRRSRHHRAAEHHQLARQRNRARRHHRPAAANPQVTRPEHDRSRRSPSIRGRDCPGCINDIRHSRKHKGSLAQGWVSTPTPLPGAPPASKSPQNTRSQPHRSRLP